MSRTLRTSFLIVGVLLSAAMVRAAAPPASESLMPDTTVGYLSLASVKQVTEQFDKTQIGQLVNDPVMQPFTKDLRRQFQEQIADFQERIGLTWDELKEVPSGEVGIGLIRPAPGQGVLAMVADATGRHEQALAAVEKASAHQVERGAKKSQKSVGEATIVIFDLPPKETKKKAGGKEAAPRSGRAVYCLTGELFIVADRLEIVEGILGRLSAPGKDTLNNVPGFKYVMTRCGTDAGKHQPHLRWYLQPAGYADAVRAIMPEERRRKGKSIFELLESQGFAAIQAVGGFVSCADEDLEIVHRTAIYAPKPWEKSMQMISFINGKDYVPQPWVPREIATYSTLYFDIPHGFDHVGPMYEQIFSRGEEGVWDEVLEGLRSVNHLDLRKELILHLGPRVTMISDYQVPITGTSERLLFAIETNNPSSVAEAIRKLMMNDKTIERREIEGQVIWEMIPDKQQRDLVDIQGLPSIDSQPQDQDADEEEPKLLPHAAVTVAHGHLFCSSHIDFLVKVLRCAKHPDRLDRDASFQLVDDTIAKFGFPEKCARTFSFTDEEFRPTYELIRQNRLPEAETMLARAINAFGGSTKGHARESKVDGRQLPSYDVVRRYLGPAGIAATVERDGWFIKGCLLPKQ